MTIGRSILLFAFLVFGCFGSSGDTLGQTEKDVLDRAIKHSEDFRSAVDRQLKEMEKKKEENRKKLEYYEREIKRLEAEEAAKKKEPGGSGGQTVARQPGSSSSSSCSDISGTSGAPRATTCQRARKALQGAREDRKSRPAMAQRQYKEAADHYRDAGDRSRAALVLLEAAARDATPFIDAEADAAKKKQNLTEGENNLRVARKIEEGAFESGSCADMEVAAKRYLDAAVHYLRADQFDLVNRILLRKDHLERLVDEARRLGRCGRRLAAVRTSNVPTASSRDDRLSSDQCRKVYEHIGKVPQLQNSREGSALKVELAAKGCHNPSRRALSERDCMRAKLQWYYVGRLPIEVIDRRLNAAGCAA